jgi:ATP-binding cassette subfamily C protein
VNRLAPAKLIDRKTGDLCSTVMSDVEYIETFFAHTLAPIIMGVIIPVIILIILGTINIFFPLILLPFYLLMGLLIPLLSFRSAAAVGSEYRDMLSEMNSALIENLQGLRELMLFNKDRRRLSSLLDDTKESGKMYKKLRSNEGWLAALVDITVVSAAAAVITLSAYLVHAGTVGPGPVVLAVVISMTSFGPLISLMFLSNNLVNTSAAAKRIFALVDETPAVENNDGCFTDFSVEGAPIARHVDFAYPGSDSTVLKDFNLIVEKGKISVLKGESGKGKSTVLYLMIRFFDPVHGKMILDGTSLQNYALDTLRTKISYFTQETTLFNLTVMENIRIADASASDEDVYQAAIKAGIHDFILSLPEGYNTKAGERGSRFSSGERQRIGLARIFLQNNDVILLDEPVSNLDCENEALIMKNLSAGLTGRTVVLVSHRNSVTELADRIIDL